MASISLATIGSSNLPADQKSAIARFYERTMGRIPGGTLARAKRHAGETGEVVRQGFESAGVGAVLGAAAAYLPNGLDVKGKYPIDAAVGAIGLIAAVAMANEEFAPDLRNAGAAGLTVFAFRKSQDWTAKKYGRRAASTTVAGDYDYSGRSGDSSDMGADPIIELAKQL